MIRLLLIFFLLTGSAASPAFPQHINNSSQHKNNIPMNTDNITNQAVKKAVDALQAGDKNTWYALFTPDATLYDDGNKIDFKSFTEAAMGHERFIAIDKVEDNSTSVYGRFHSDRWGNFKTYFRFHEGADGRFIRLEIGQASY